MPPKLSASPALCLFQAGKFDTVPTLINLVAAFTSVGLVGVSDVDKDDKNVFLFLLSAFIILSLLCWQGTVLCDVILLNFLKGAEQYKAKKFEEVIKFVFARQSNFDQGSNLRGGGGSVRASQIHFIVLSVQVSEAQIEASLAQSPGSQLSLKPGIKSSYDSGAISLATSEQPSD